MEISEIIATAAIVLNVAVYSMKTMIPLRIFAILTNVLFIAYAALAGVYPMLILNCILLPLNAWRLHQMLNLVRRIKRATGAEFDMNWLKPFMTRHKVRADEILFRKGEAADSMFLVASGHFALAESSIEIPVGSVVGEMGLLSPDGKRTQTLVCREAGEVLSIGYQDFKQLYFQNPEFGFYFLQLTTGRLFENIGKLENTLLTRDVLVPAKSG